MTSSSTPQTVAPPRGERVPGYVYVLVAALLLQVFSGNSDRLGFPIGPDRLLLLVGLTLMATSKDMHEWRVAVRPLHLLMFAAVAWCIASAISVGTVTDPTAVFAVLDAFGILPFTFLLIAPVVFCTQRRRAVLLTGLVGLGFYLGATSVLEGLSLGQLVWPSYIGDPSVGAHYGRARGPFLQAAANGLALTTCGVAAAMGVAIWHRRVPRAMAAITLLLCAAGILLTYTRSVWLAAIGGAVLAMLLDRRLRRLIIVVIPALGLAVAAALVSSPSIRDAVEARLGYDRSGIDRIIANDAAFRILADRPLHGVGWQRFPAVQDEWVRQADTLPITSTGISVHNVPLGFAAELGIPGALLWLGVVILAVSATVRRGTTAASDVHAWRLGLVVVGTSWFVVAMLVPIGYAFPNSMLWLWIGLVANPRKLGLTRRSPGQHDGTRPHDGISTRETA